MDTENPAKNDSLQFVISENSDLHFSVCKKDLPPVLVQANKAAGDGQVTEAIELLNEQAVEEIEQIINDDASRTDIMFMLAAVFYKTRQMEQAASLSDHLACIVGLPLCMSDLQKPMCIVPCRCRGFIIK